MTVKLATTHAHAARRAMSIPDVGLQGLGRTCSTATLAGIQADNTSPSTTNRIDRRRSFPPHTAYGDLSPSPAVVFFAIQEPGKHLDSPTAFLEELRCVFT